MIRFENTGNAAAENVVITTDINPADYDLNTLQVLNASHDMFMRHNNGVIEFVFENIQLAGGGGHGNILLKIKTRPDLSITDEVDAQADIYFDFNFPIITNIANTAFAVLSVNDFTAEIETNMYPNPTDALVTVESASQLQNITIYDIQGRIVYTEKYTDNSLKSTIDVSTFVKGVYLVKLLTTKGQVTKKLIRQ
jgi:hypothetical protein